MFRLSNREVCSEIWRLTFFHAQGFGEIGIA